MATKLIKFSKTLCMRNNNTSKIHAYVKPFFNQTTKMARTYATATAKNMELLSSSSSSPIRVMVTSREMVKPSSPTPRDMNIVHLSVLDQLAPSFHNPMIWFYQNDSQPDREIDHFKRSMSLKRSLSETLVQFYPLAGRTNGNVSIDCDDQGVEFCEGYVFEELADVIKNPCVNELRGLLPFQDMPRHKNIVLSVQVNYFSCGGMAISMCISHKIADGLGCVEFIRAWSAMARKGIDRCHVYNNKTRPVEFTGASYFPPLLEFNDTRHEEYSKVHDDKIVSKRVIFDKKTLDDLKSRLFIVNEPTRVEIVSSFLWKLFMTKIPSISAAVHAVNLRKRVTPSIPEGYFGNFVLLTTTASLGNGAGQRGYDELINESRKAIKKLDNNYLEKLLKSDERLFELKYKEYDNINHGKGKCCFTSLCNFPIYEVDFGMGKPIWACHAASPVNNLVVLWDTKCGRGIEAWVHMLADDMQSLDLDPREIET